MAEAEDQLARAQEQTARAIQGFVALSSLNPVGGDPVKMGGKHVFTVHDPATGFDYDVAVSVNDPR